MYDKEIYSGFLLLLLGLGCLVSAGSSGSFCLCRVAVSLSLRDLPGNSLAAAPAGSPLGFPLLLFLVLLVGRLGNLDDYLSAIELLLVKKVDSLLRGLCA